MFAQNRRARYLRTCAQRTFAARCRAMPLCAVVTRLMMLHLRVAPYMLPAIEQRLLLPRDCPFRCYAAMPAYCFML